MKSRDFFAATAVLPSGLQDIREILTSYLNDKYPGRISIDSFRIIIRHEPASISLYHDDNPYVHVVVPSFVHTLDLRNPDFFQKLDSLIDEYSRF